MSTFAVVVFKTEPKAHDGMAALLALHDTGKLDVYGIKVVSRDADGKIALTDGGTTGPEGLVAGVLAGALVRLAGPASVVGLAGSGILGTVYDLFSLGIGAEFLEKVISEVQPGSSAVIAEIEESRVAPLDTRMAALGGIVLRTRRVEFEEIQIASVVAASRADYEHLKAEAAAATFEIRDSLQARLETAKANLAAAQNRAADRLEAIESEAKAKASQWKRQA